MTLSQGDNETGTSTAANPDRRMSDGDPTTPSYLSYGLFTDLGQNVPAGNYTDLVVATVTF